MTLLVQNHPAHELPNPQIQFFNVHEILHVLRRDCQSYGENQENAHNHRISYCIMSRQSRARNFPPRSSVPVNGNSVIRVHNEGTKKEYAVMIGSCAQLRSTFGPRINERLRFPRQEQLAAVSAIIIPDKPRDTTGDSLIDIPLAARTELFFRAG